MLLTSDEATKHVCPHIQYVQNEASVVQEKDAAIIVHQQCQGAACGMAWRWYDQPRCGLDEQGQTVSVALSERRGYCGIAGRPQHAE
jgi:hypothetical protein